MNKQDFWRREMSDRYDDGHGLAMLIAGFGLGTLVGTVIGLLIAPKSGRELRADIAEYGRDAYDKVKDTGREAYEKGRERARHAYEAGREKAGEYSSVVKDKASDVREQLSSTAHRFGEAVRAGVERARGEAGSEPGPEQPA
jgi:gas vesicle protein